MLDEWKTETKLDADCTMRRLHNPVVTREKILMIEDDPELRSALCKHLEAKGFDVTAVEDGISAIDVLRDVDHDAILLDLGIPRMGGGKFLHELRRDESIVDLPIVILSGSDEECIDRAARHGVFAVHRKPTKARDIARSLRLAVYFA